MAATMVGLATPDRFEELMGSLYSGNAGAQVAALRELGAMGEAGAEEFDTAGRAVELFSDRDLSVQTAAVTALGNMGSSAAPYAMDVAQMLSSADTEVKQAALLTLGYIGDQRYLPNVTEFLDNQDLDLVADACTATGYMGASSAIKTLEEKLQAKDAGVVAAAAGSLCMLGADLDVVKKVLAKSEANVKVAALTGLAKHSQTEKLSTPIAALVGDSNCQVRIAAASLICTLGEKAAGEAAALGKLLTSKDVGVKACAATALGGIGEKASSQVDAVAALLTDESEDKSTLVLSTAGVQAKAAATSRKPACAAAAALAGMKATKHASAVASGMTSKDFEMRIACLKALAAMGKAGTEFADDAMKMIEDPMPLVTATACIALGDMVKSGSPSSAAAEKLAECLKDKLPTVRAAACQGLAKMGDEATSYLDVIAKCLNDQIWSVRAAACDTVAGCGEMGQMYAADVCRLIFDNNTAVRVKAIESLAKMGERGKAFDEEVETLLDDPVPSVREAAMLSLDPTAKAKKQQEQQRALADKAAADTDAFKRMSAEERIAWRCQRECNKKFPVWQPMSMEQVQENHSKYSKGMCYDLEFPWDSETLVSLGAKWLTKAFHAAGTMSTDNAVTEVIIDEQVVDDGNNAGKFLFEVRYAKEDPTLHKKMFAKCPFAMTKESSGDRISSSVYKQPQDLNEINCYRLLEATFPFKVPKYYYGDVSNTTSNFILITERVPFTGIGKNFKPYEVEGPYVKCKDYELKGAGKEYYMEIVKTHAKLAAYHSSGKLCSQSVADGNLSDVYKGLVPGNPMSWGANPDQNTGGDPKMSRNVLDVTVDFFGNIAKAIYPSYASSDAFQKKFLQTMMTFLAYRQEVDYYRGCFPELVAYGHANMNIDNAYFWRKDDGKIDMGVFDFGGFGNKSMGHTIWWSFNCADYNNFADNLDAYVAEYCKTYKESGGPEIDAKILKQHVIMSVFDNIVFMSRAIPNCYKMCKKEEWATIKDRKDPRIASNVTGKSTLRTTITVLGNGIRILEELKADKVLSDFIDEVFVGQWGLKKKSDAVIWGEGGAP